MTVEPIKDKQMVKYCMNYLERKNPRDMVMFAIGVCTGLRISDILELRVGSVYQRSTFRIRQKKTGKMVTVYINNQLRDIINNYAMHMLEFEYLIQSREGINAPLTRSQAYKILNNMGRRLGLGKIGTHTLRKTAGYHLYKKTNDIGLVMDILGQVDPRSTLRYIGILEEEKKRAIKSLSY
jgi:integrase